MGEGRRRVLGFLPGSCWADPPSSRIRAFWTRELFYLGLIREERTAGWHSGDAGDVLSRVPPYLILAAPTLHAAVVCWEGGRELEGIVNYMLEQGRTGERLPFQLSYKI